MANDAVRLLTRRVMFHEPPAEVRKKLCAYVEELLNSSGPGVQVPRSVGQTANFNPNEDAIILSGEALLTLAEQAPFNSREGVYRHLNTFAQRCGWQLSGVVEKNNHFDIRFTPIVSKPFPSFGLKHLWHATLPKYKSNIARHGIMPRSRLQGNYMYANRLHTFCYHYQPYISLIHNNIHNHGGDQSRRWWPLVVFQIDLWRLGSSFDLHRDTYAHMGIWLNQRVPAKFLRVVYEGSSWNWWVQLYRADPYRQVTQEDLLRFRWRLHASSKPLRR